jgi:hypothetical protein
MLRKSMIALAALTSVGTAALAPTSASAFGGNHGGGNHGGFGSFGGYHGGFSSYNGYRNHSGYWNSYCCWSYGYQRSSYSAPSYSPYSAPSYPAPTPPIAVTQKVYVEGNNNSGPPPIAPEGPPPR